MANFLSVDNYYMVTKWIVAKLKEDLRSGSHNSPLATSFVWKKYIKRDWTCSTERVVTYELSPKYILSTNHQFCFWTQNGVTEIGFALSPETARTNNNQTRHNIGNSGFQNSRHQAAEVVVA